MECQRGRKTNRFTRQLDRSLSSRTAKTSSSNESARISFKPVPNELKESEHCGLRPGRQIAKIWGAKVAKPYGGDLEWRLSDTASKITSRGGQRHVASHNDSLGSRLNSVCLLHSQPWSAAVQSLRSDPHYGCQVKLNPHRKSQSLRSAVYFAGWMLRRGRFLPRGPKKNTRGPTTRLHAGQNHFHV
jgi:hypothetical protein